MFDIDDLFVTFGSILSNFGLNCHPLELIELSSLKNYQLDTLEYS